jgi:hypothetical protein
LIPIVERNEPPQWTVLDELKARGDDALATGWDMVRERRTYCDERKRICALRK